MWLPYLLGLTSPNDWPYLAWSGVLPGCTALGAGYAIWRRHSCHRPWCFRILRHATEHGSWCRKHHITPEDQEDNKRDFARQSLRDEQLVRLADSVERLERHLSGGRPDVQD